MQRSVPDANRYAWRCQIEFREAGRSLELQSRKGQPSPRRRRTGFADGPQQIGRRPDVADVNRGLDRGGCANVDVCIDESRNHPVALAVEDVDLLAQSLEHIVSAPEGDHAPSINQDRIPNKARFRSRPDTCIDESYGMFERNYRHMVTRFGVGLVILCR